MKARWSQRNVNTGWGGVLCVAFGGRGIARAACGGTNRLHNHEVTKKTKRALWVGIGSALLVVATGFQLTRRFFESPKYTVIEQHGDIEIRRYAPRLVAETWVQADTQRKAANVGFRRLANFIFGDNRDIAMTTPVEVGGQKIAMTTPVEAQARAQAGYRVAFTMPREYALDSIPKPNDDAIKLRTIDEQTVAALRFSGGADAADEKRHANELLGALSSLDYRVSGSVTLARYDPPMWVLPIFRRNEVLVEVEAR